MFYSLLKGYARLVLPIIFRKVVVTNGHWLHQKGPVLFACNHPNSFLDGVLLTVLSRYPVYSLARGDAFKGKKGNHFLRWLRLLPVYRTSEGVENLEHNYTTFSACKEIFKAKESVIIFSEGRCINEWHLRPLKKGTARLAISAWKDGTELTVVPVGLNYSSFRNFGKNVFIHFGDPISTAKILVQETEGKALIQFNNQLQTALKNLVYEVKENDAETKKKKLFVAVPVWKKALLFLPAAVGFLIHTPIYLPFKKLNDNYFDNDHYDSTMVGFLFLFYPFFLLLFYFLLLIFFSWFVALLLMLFVPFSAWCFVQLKPQLS